MGTVPKVRSWEHPECPKCETDVMVDGCKLDRYDYICRACGFLFSVDHD